MDYKTRLMSLNILPLMMLYELMFFVCNLKEPSNSFNIMKFISFNKSSTRSSSGKLVHSITSINSQRHFYFNRLIRLWNALPIINLSQSANTIRSKIKGYLWSIFIKQFNPNNSIQSVPVAAAHQLPGLPTFTHRIFLFLKTGSQTQIW